MVEPVHVAAHFLMYKLPIPEELVPVETQRAAMLRMLVESPAFAAMPCEEASASCLSLALTLTRAEYHEKRFHRVLDVLEVRRIALTGEPTGDLLLKYAIFEAAAALAAARLGLDELTHLIGRRCGAPLSEGGRWEASKVLGATPPAIPRIAAGSREIETLRRNHLPWFEDLRAYRNVLVHRGWRESIGLYIPRGYTGPAADDAERNVLLVPDRASLEKEARPHQWTYLGKRRLEDLLQTCLDGLRSAFDDVCTNCWGVVHPPPGTDPEGINLFLGLPTPSGTVVNGVLSLVFFTSEAAAVEFGKVFWPQGGPQLARLPCSSLPWNQPAYLFSLHNAKAHLQEMNIQEVVISMNPDIVGNNVLHRTTSPPHALTDEVYTVPMGIPVDMAGGAKVVYCWSST